MNAEKAALNTEIMQLKQNIIGLDEGKKMAISEKERLEQVLSNRLNEIEEMQGKHIEFESQKLSEFNQLKKQFEEYKLSHLVI